MGADKITQNSNDLLFSSFYENRYFCLISNVSEILTMLRGFNLFLRLVTFTYNRQDFLSKQFVTSFYRG